jgi:UDP-glucose 4-epimerase
MTAREKNSILVTGGRGFIGRALVKLIQRTGFSVISLDQNPAAVTTEKDCEEMHCDLTDAAQLRSVFVGHRIRKIVHLAAILPTAAQRNPLRATEVNVQGSLNLLELAREFKVHRFVFGGSLSVYGTYHMNQTVSEADQAAPEDLYGAAKLYVEQLGQAYRECHGLKFVSLRIGRVVGPGAQSVSSAWRSEIFELLKADYPAEISLPYRALENLLVLHVDDLAAMLFSLVRASSVAHTVYNAPCKSVVVADLKRVVEDLNSNITVKLGNGTPAGNPQVLDASRFQNEFHFRSVSIFDRLRKAGGK